MLLTLQRFLILVMPYVFCSTLAALLIWEQDYKKYFYKLLQYSLLASITQTATYIVDNEAIRFPIEIISGLLLAFLVFRQPLKWAFKIYASSYFVGIASTLTSIVIAEILGYTLALHLDEPGFWIKFVLPGNLLLLGLAFMIRSGKLPLRDLLQVIREKSAALWPIFIAFFIQLVILLSITGEMLRASQNHRSLYLLLAATALFSLSIYIVIRFIKSNREAAIVATHESLAQNIRDMVDSIRGQRHDFLNHLQVINALYSQGSMAILGEYLEKLLSETAHYNELLKINNPVLSALINAKMAQADERGITIKVNIQTSFPGLDHASIDLARILGNLLDNAMDAVESGESKKIIDLRIYEEGPLFIASVSNPWQGRVEDLDKAFSHGISSKGESHQGLGLLICRQLAKKLHGSLDFSCSDPSTITFSLVVPI